jgi:hypothetical protein
MPKGGTHTVFKTPLSQLWVFEPWVFEACLVVSGDDTALKYTFPSGWVFHTVVLDKLILEAVEVLC